MNAPLVLTQSALRDFVACPRRFQLRYLERLPWPRAPLQGQTAVAINRGQAFHQLLERHFLGIPVTEADLTDDALRAWWRSFMRSGPILPDGRRWQEHEVTIPIGDHFLNGRFDLLIVSETEESVSAHLFDWKTSRPQTLAHLRQDWQTRLYLAMLAESGAALTDGQRPLEPDNLTMTYWYAQDAGAPRVIRYSREEHQQAWAEINALVNELAKRIQEDNWPLTADLMQCRECAYQVICGRQAAGQGPGAEDENAVPDIPDDAIQLEPQTP